MALLLYALTFCSMVFNVFATNDADCPSSYQRFSQSHSYCQPRNMSCEILAFVPNKDDISKILDYHNLYRSGIALNQKNLSPAADMLEMEWDDELAAVAQKYALQCMYAHDNPNARRVVNFGVGQNIAIQTRTGAHEVPLPDWNFAVGDWFAEIMYFSPNLITDFTSPKQSDKEYRHFTQLVWSSTYRVGCGYVLYKEGEDDLMNLKYVRLYICNYGPAGNVYGDPVFKIGSACSSCPQNTCCGSSCGKYSGLCKRTDNTAPFYPPKYSYKFLCTFKDESDCSNYVLGENAWYIMNTLGGNFLEIVLEGGKNSTIGFRKHVNTTSNAMCLTVNYRKGPNVDSNQNSNQAVEEFTLPDKSFTTTEVLPDYPEGSRQQFSIYNETLSWNFTTELKFSFSVPSGSPAQFFNLKDIRVTDGACN